MNGNRTMSGKRSLRIGNVSGATGDHPQAMSRMAREGNVDIIVGDWLSEMNIAWNAVTKLNNPDQGYEEGFLTQLAECLDVILSNRIKVVANAGALNTPSLGRKVQDLCQDRGNQNLVVATVIGDDISELLQRQGPELQCLHHLDHQNWQLADWPLQPLCGVAYIGAWGIVEALQAGADIVVCGRVTDASPVVGAAAWWYSWERSAWDQLAGSLVAGHLIECGPYVTGANFSGFKSNLDELVDLAFPIAEILEDGTCIITKCEGYGGAVTQHNTTAQFLYELQGELYLNPDVVADLGSICIENAGLNRVRVSCIKGLPPPATTKAMIAAPGGYQAETTFYINGLDIHKKAQMMRNQLSHMFQGHNFTKFSVDLYGSAPADPRSQNEGTVSLRVFVQSRKKEDLAPERFRIPIYALRMQSYPGYHMNLDFRAMEPRPYMEMFPVMIPLQWIDHRVVIFGTGKDTPTPNTIIHAPSPPCTASYPVERPSYETKSPVPLDWFAPATRAPLGSIVHARSGDKADNSNVGFFVRHADEYPWLQSFLTVTRLQDLFAEDWPQENVPRVERCEFPTILAVHFRVLDFLDGGIASSSRIDGLGKGVGEYLRSRLVDVPIRFLERGWI